MTDFNWFKEECVAVKPRTGIAVYLNTSGDVVIRQQCTDGSDDDMVIIDIDSAKTVASAILDVIGEP